MEILDNILNKSRTLDSDSELPTDEFYLGLTLSSYLSSPSIPSAQYLLRKFPSLPEPSKSKVSLIFLQILLSILENTKKTDQVASLFECSAKICLSLHSEEVKSKQTKLFDTLLDRASPELSLQLIRFNKTLHLPHFSSELTDEDINGLDLSISCEVKQRFKSVKTVYSLYKSSGKYSVLSSLGFRCIEFVFIYLIPDLRGYGAPVEEQINDNMSCFSYEQRLKLANLYEKLAVHTKTLDPQFKMNSELIKSLRKVNFTDPTLVNDKFIEFTYLVEDILQFDLPSHVIRQRIKSLHGKYKGKEFSKNLIQALQAVMDDDPGFKVLKMISDVLKPLKLLSKNEFLHFKRNEKKINSEKNLERSLYCVPEGAKGDSGKIREFIGKNCKGVAGEDERGRMKRDFERLESCLREVNGKIKNVEIFGSYLLNTWIEGTDVDINITIDSIEDKSIALQAIKYKLSPTWECELIDSKSNPSLTLKSKENGSSFTITINNTQGQASTLHLLPLLPPQTPLSSLLCITKSFAKHQNWKTVKTGTFSGYEWTLLLLSYIKSENLDSSLKGRQIEEVFFSFLHFLFNNLGKVLSIDSGVTEKTTKSVIGIIYPVNNKESASKIVLNRKQGFDFHNALADVLRSLAII